MCATKIVCSNKCTRTYGPYVRVVRIGLNKMVQFFDSCCSYRIVSYELDGRRERRNCNCDYVLLTVGYQIITFTTKVTRTQTR